LPQYDPKIVARDSILNLLNFFWQGELQQEQHLRSSVDQRLVSQVVASWIMQT